MVALKVAFDTLCRSTAQVSIRELRGEDYLVTILALLQPLADPGLALTILVVVGSIDEVAAFQDGQIDLMTVRGLSQ